MGVRGLIHLKWLWCLGILLMGQLATAQLPGQLVFKRLLAPDMQGVHISPTHADFSPFVDSSISKRSGHFIRQGARLFYWLTGSGRTYELMKTDSGNYRFVRLDSTEMQGYNICAFPFSHQSVLYNMGGYGFWRVNGQLRYFNTQTHEWDIVHLNKEFPLIYSVEEGSPWWDAQLGRLYLPFQLYREQAVTDERTLTNTMQVLDVKNRKWKQVGVTSEWLTKRYYQLRVLTNTKKGLVCNINDQLFLLDFRNNRILKTKKSYTAATKLHITNGFIDPIYFDNDSTLFVGSVLANRLDSIPFSLDNFEATGIPIYETNTSAANIEWLFIISGVLLSGSAFFVWYSKKKTREQNSKLKIPQLIVDSIDSLQLHPSQAELLRLVYSNSLQQQTTTIEEINKVLGIAQKNGGVQKKQRSDAIIAINKTFRNFGLATVDVITKTQLESDKRSFVYFINGDCMAVVQRLIY